MATDATQRRLAAILSADVVGYSRLMARDEDSTVRTLTAYRDEIALLVGQQSARGAPVSKAGVDSALGWLLERLLGRADPEARPAPWLPREPEPGRRARGAGVWCSVSA